VGPGVGVGASRARAREVSRVRVYARVGMATKGPARLLLSGGGGVGTEHSSAAFHHAPETNGCAEKAIQVLKEQLLWIARFDTPDDLRQAVRRFGRTYNEQWLIERHGYRTPIESRDHLPTKAATAT
jgi:hypothetical protein